MTSAEPRNPAPVPMPPDLERVRRALASMPPGAPPSEGDLAAVALVLAGQPADLHVCLIRRAEHEHDRWSGHIALPGGRVDAEDVSALAAAIRETREEVGLRLDDAPCLGSLGTQPVRSAGRITGMSLSPFVFHLGATLEPLTPTDGEVAEAFWVPLRHLLDPRNAARRPTPRDGVIFEFPAVLYEGHYIWGLTYRVLGTFFEHMDLAIADPEVEASH
ncbi:MAG TPA: CoA pyrophosphatase [Candidatus Methylomirabilis sp.]|nr:CoA pyrophosphatase [Candidatus Methylomirabilis sp.]